MLPPLDVMRYVALLRAINLGSHQKIAMADLRELLAGLGYTNVVTYLQSGNAVFTAPRQRPDQVAADIEDRLARDLAMPVRVIVRTADELRAVIDRNPMEVRDPAKFVVLFLQAAPDLDALRAIDPGTYAPEEFRIGDRELYFSLPGGIGRAKLPQLLERRLRGIATARNWNTTVKLLELAETDTS